MELKSELLESEKTKQTLTKFKVLQIIITNLKLNVENFAYLT